MAAPATKEAFLDLVRKSGVVHEDHLNACLQRLTAAQQEKPLQKFAEVLVEEGLLTHYQAVQLLKGRLSNFRIGPYHILERLGVGATSNVYLCEHKATHARVAVKVLAHLSAEDPVALKRFFREARAATSLEHPNFVRMIDIDWDNQDNYMVTEFVEGSSIEDIVQQFGPMDIHRAAEYVRQVAMGLHFAYQAGVVHRDIRPGNLLIDRSGAVKILDMGLARFAEEEGGMLTQGEVLGSPEYLSPEQAIDSHNVDSRTDIYSLGATLYCMVVGEAPYSEERSAAGKLLSKGQRPPKAVRSLRPEVPAELEAVIEKMMAKDPAQRYQTPREVADALAPWTEKSLPPPPDKEMPRLSKAALSGQAELRKSMPAAPIEAANDQQTFWFAVQVILVALVSLATFLIAWEFLGQQ